MAQTWEDLLFAHWPVHPSVLRAVVPSQIPIDTFAGVGWIAVTPFELRTLRLRGLPPPPVVSRFPELNVRTYTTIGGRPGIWFFSLDAASRLAVAGARRLYRLPYFHARMRAKREGSWMHYCSRRTNGAGGPAELVVSYGSLAAPFQPQAGSLEYFLTERYCLYSIDERGQVLRAEIQHAPWSLRPAIADISTNTMTLPLGIELPLPETLLHLGGRQDVVIWPPTVIA